MKYLQLRSEKMILRDHLAYDRTTLANERTLLAYMRTAIMLIATGVTAIKLFPADRVMLIVGCVLSLGAGIIAVVGAVRFLMLRRSLGRLYSRDLDKSPEGPGDSV